jgi:hypothetical protein
MKASKEKRMETMRHEIMCCVKANGLPVTGDLFFSLVFRTESELKKICHELHIKTN